MPRVATYSGPYIRNVHMHGLGMSICLDQSQNTIACTDPDCTYGDCGSTDTQQVGGALCLDQSENQVPCSSVNCTYGDCVTQPQPSKTAAAVVQAAAGIPMAMKPSPTVQVPLSTSSIGLWFGSSTAIPGVPNYLLALAAVVVVGGVLAGSGRRR